uniref:Uncharacterized protein n=1 Tax=Meloidogyne incognita TaxID=6306 RepID=A0A914NMU6_MELIC
MAHEDFSRSLRELAERMSNNIQGLEVLEELQSEVQQNLEKQENSRKIIKSNSDNNKTILPIITLAVIAGTVFSLGILSGHSLPIFGIGAVVGAAAVGFVGGNGGGSGRGVVVAPKEESVRTIEEVIVGAIEGGSVVTVKENDGNVNKKI